MIDFLYIYAIYYNKPGLMIDTTLSSKVELFFFLKTIGEKKNEKMNMLALK